MELPLTPVHQMIVGLIISVVIVLLKFMEESVEKITLPVQLFNALMQYLNTKPHGEVRQLIDAIQKEIVEQQTPPQEQ